VTVPERASEPEAADVDVDALARAARDGDAAAVEALLRALLPRARRWLYRLLGPDALDDAVQEALIAIAAAVPRFRGDAAFETYAHRIAVRVAYRHLKAQRRRPSLTLVAPPADDRDPESRAISRQQLERLRVAVDGLSPDARVAFVLCSIEGRPPREAAAIAGTSALVMRVRAHRARKAVERSLGADPMFSDDEGGAR